MADLTGKVAVVTGGSKGIGRGIAQALVAAGAKLVLCSRHESEAAEAAGEMSVGGPGRASGVGADVRRLDDVRRLIGVAREQYGGLDILVANAGVGGGFAPIDEIDPEDWRRVIETNLTGVYYCCHEAVPELKRRGGGWIITIGSLAGRYPFAGGTAYNASKHGLIGFTEALMLDVRHHGIRVSCVMPGSVGTDFRGHGSEDDSWKLTPADIARVVLQLLDHDPRSLPSKIEIRPSQPRRS